VWFVGNYSKLFVTRLHYGRDSIILSCDFCSLVYDLSKGFGSNQAEYIIYSWKQDFSSLGATVYFSLCA
jgi:hypothetical protein